MGLLEVLLRQSYFGQECINRWHYEYSGTPAAVSFSFALASAFGGIPDPITGEFPGASIMSDLANIQHTNLAYIELQVEDLYVVENFYTIPYGSDQHGLVTGTPMAKYEAYKLRSNRLRTDIRRGHKRLAGVSEGAVGDDGAVGGDVLTALNSLAEEMSSILTYDDEGNTLSFTPVVLSFQEYTTPAGNPAYEKYPTLSDQLDHAAIGVTWTAIPFTTTQNSRKR